MRSAWHSVYLLAVLYVAFQITAAITLIPLLLKEMAS
jgi:hypothetical protein